MLQPLCLHACQKSVFGNQSTRPGKATSKPISTSDRMTNGSVPMKISFKDTILPATCFKTKQLKPTGGVTSAISTNRTQITPNQIGSKPKRVTSGKTKGNASNSIPMGSRIIPRSRNMTMLMSLTTYQFSPASALKLTKVGVTFVRTRKLVNKFTVMKIAKIIIEIFAVETADSTNAAQVSRRIRISSTSTANAPAPAASDGVKTPE